MNSHMQIPELWIRLTYANVYTCSKNKKNENKKKIFFKKYISSNNNAYRSPTVYNVADGARAYISKKKREKKKYIHGRKECLDVDTVGD